ncbi:MAG: DUF1501 domain-containing protein [Planctomycetaceae bacterium]
MKPNQTTINGCCDEFRTGRSGSVSRRGLLQIGGLSLLAPQLPGPFSQSAEAFEGPLRFRSAPRIKSCLILFQAGGVSQTDTVDMRPDADDSIRGEFSPVSTTVPGMQICEHMPRLAQQMDKVCVVRSMYHRMLCHNPACYSALAGRDVGASKAVSNQTPATQNDYPNFGSAIAKFRPHPPGLPAFVSMPFSLFNGPAKTPGQNAGMLGSHFDPFLIDSDPSQPDWRVDELWMREGMQDQRYRSRRGLLANLDRQVRTFEDTRSIDQMQTYYQRAFSLLMTARSREAFDLSREKTELRERYGMHQTGQSTLLARRLIEAGVPFVTVYAPVQRIEGVSWDTHRDNFPLLKNTLLPPADQSFSALLEDMHQRGLLDETLVIWMGEFGRTPKIGYTQSNNTNNSSGRDHHPYCYSILLAGAGVRGGSYFGRSDKDGWYPADSPVHPGDLGATVYDAFGIDPHQEIRDRFGRPHRLIEGQPVAGLF